MSDHGVQLHVRRQIVEDAGIHEVRGGEVFPYSTYHSTNPPTRFVAW